MDFFENLSKKATEAGSKALEMTKGFSDTAVFKSTISTEEKNIKSMYYQIGELYFSTHKQDYEEPFGSMIQSIRSSKEKIKECKEQIRIIKDIHYCENCGAEVPNSSYYCSACGMVTKQYQPNTVNPYIQCPQCGSLVENGLKFCTSCGAPVTTEATPSPATANTVPCPQCGSPVANDLKFCIFCGAPMTAESSAEESAF